MKKAALLLFSCALVVCACEKDPSGKNPVKESDLTGETVDVEVMGFGYSGPRKIFVLNEGQMGSNNASLDILRMSDGQYITGVFKKVNPDAGGLGDVGNDIVVIGDEVWIVVNNSGIVEVISAEDEKEIAAIAVPTPRRIAYDDNYAYVTSWAGSFITYDKDENGVSYIKESANFKGKVYKIDLQTKKVEGSVEVGYQPEGIALLDGKLYVANSGGISCSLPPDYAYDPTVSVIDTESFSVTESLDVEINLKDVYADAFRKSIYVTTQGNYFDVHTGLYVIQADKNVYCASQYVSVSSNHYNDVYCIGAEEEYDWENPARTWSAWAWRNGHKELLILPLDGLTPYGLFVPKDGVYLIADAGDYFNPGTVTLVAGGRQAWTVTAGVCPGHFAIW